MRGLWCTISDMVHHRPPLSPNTTDWKLLHSLSRLLSFSFFLPSFLLRSLLSNSSLLLKFSCYVLATIHTAFPSPPWDFFSSRFSFYVSLFYQFLSPSWFILYHRCKRLRSLHLNPVAAVLWILLGSCQLTQRYHPTCALDLESCW